MNYEEGIERLTEIIEKLEAGCLSLEESVRLYTEGAAVAAKCEEELSTARLQIEGLGEASAQDSDV